MGNAFSKYIRNSTDKAIDKVQNFGDKLRANVGRIEGYVGTAFEVAKNGETFVGIDYGQVPKIRGAIKKYVTAVQTEIAKMNAETESTTAFKSTELNTSIQKYVMGVEKAASAYVSALLAYADKMQEYAYGVEGDKTGSIQGTEEDMTSDVAKDATDIESSADEYKEKYAIEDY